MSEEKREILGHLVEYLQQKIDSGEHKIFFNDLMWDEKTIDCINAINNTLEEIERLNKELEEYQKALDETISEKIDLENIIKEVSKELKEFNEEYLVSEGDHCVYRYLNELIDKLNEGE